MLDHRQNTSVRRLENKCWAMARRRGLYRWRNTWKRQCLRSNGSLVTLPICSGSQLWICQHQLTSTLNWTHRTSSTRMVYGSTRAHRMLRCHKETQSSWTCSVTYKAFDNWNHILLEWCTHKIVLQPFLSQHSKRNTTRLRTTQVSRECGTRSATDQTRDG